PSERCNRRISAQSSTDITSSASTEGVQIQPTIRGQSSPDADTSGNDRALWSLFTLTTTGSRPRPIAKEDQIPVSKTDDKPTPRFTRGQLAQLGEVS
ncbi:MAG: DNA-binding protein, partial [Mycobacterium sp.]|nr:DNA-binding protein [Mycobacterium sp.]